MNSILYYTRLTGLLLASVFLTDQAVHAQQRYEAFTDLGAIDNDKLEIEIRVPTVQDKQALFVFPKIVPGTYDNSSFGRFVEDFSVYDAGGKRLKAKAVDVNAFRVRRSDKAASVRYRMNDTWDDRSGNYIFQPTGTHFKAGEEFVINSFGLFGYFDGYVNDIPYQVTIAKPEHLYGATSLDRLSSGPGEDVFTADSYVELVDQPILYARPDTVSYFENGARIGIAVHSPVDAINAGVLLDMIRPITRATSYVLGEIPTDEYWFLFHYFNWDDEEFTIGRLGAYGALEHNKSSLYFVPTFLDEDSVDMERVQGTINDMATHEFLHILSPLNLHSEEIAYFDFYNTEMSQHLWLYEGVTEYLSIKSLLLGGVIDMEEFNEEIISKIEGANRYSNISFTEMSRNIIDSDMQREFGNVYEKGALLAMILDLKIAEVTNGRMDLIDLVLELIQEYGMDKPFRDDELFDIIADRTAPEVRDFFRRHFEGNEELPIRELMASCGVDFSLEVGDDKYSFGPFSMAYDPEVGLLNIAPREGNTIIPKPVAISRLNDEDMSFRAVRNLLMNPSNDDPLKIEYVEDGTTQTLTLVPEMGEGDPIYRISRMKDQNETQAMLFNKLFIMKAQN